MARINHVTILVSDKKDSEDFYTNVLGFEKVLIGSHLWIRIGEQFIHVSQTGTPIAGTFYHFGVEIDNLHNYLTKLIEKGVEVFDFDEDYNRIKVNERLDEEERNFFIHDPDGNVIEFIELGNPFFNP